VLSGLLEASALAPFRLPSMQGKKHAKVFSSCPPPHAMFFEESGVWHRPTASEMRLIGVADRVARRQNRSDCADTEGQALFLTTPQRVSDTCRRDAADFGYDAACHLARRQCCLALARRFGLWFFRCGAPFLLNGVLLDANREIWRSPGLGTFPQGYKGFS